MLRFTQPGTALIRVTGIERPGDLPVVLERSITVGE
jgi:hypothetical protein